MKTLKLDIDKVMEGLVGDNPDTICIYVMRGLNWADISMLIQVSGGERSGAYGWKDINHVFDSPRKLFPSAKEALFWAFKENHEVMQFHDLKEFCVWYIEDRYGKEYTVTKISKS